jgi:hypothetical protein
MHERHDQEIRKKVAPLFVGKHKSMPPKLIRCLKQGSFGPKHIAKELGLTPSGAVCTAASRLKARPSSACSTTPGAA